MSAPLASLGASVLAGWIALALLGAVARWRRGAPASLERAFRVLMVLACLAFLLPLLRALPVDALPELPAPLPTQGETLTAAVTATVAWRGVPWLAVVGAAWLGGLAVTVAAALWRARSDRRLHRPAALEIREIVAEVAREHGVSVPETVVAPEGVPCVSGLWTPRLVLPEAALGALSPSGLRWVVWHELTHLARHDHWWATLAEAFRALFVGHPMRGGVLRRWRLWREAAVDARVPSGERGAYARALLAVATLAPEPRFLSPAMGAAALSRRIDLLVTPQRGRPRAWPMGLVTLALVAGVALAPRTSAAGDAAVPEVSLPPDLVLHIPVGGVLSLELTDVARIAISEPAVVDTTLRERFRIDFRGLSVGQSRVLVWKTSGARQDLLVRVDPS